MFEEFKLITINDRLIIIKVVENGSIRVEMEKIIEIFDFLTLDFHNWQGM